jgi:hypothetical protein
MSLVGSGVLEILLGMTLAKPQSEAFQEADEAIDNARPPFSISVDYDDPLWTGEVKIVLDRELTLSEQGEMHDIASLGEGGSLAIWEYLQSIGGRLLFYPSDIPLPDQADGLRWPRGEATVFNMDIFSERQSQVSITDMRVVNVSCREPSAQAVIVIPPQGGFSYDGIRVDLTAADPVPLITDPGEDLGQPYFSERRIDLGNGQSPGGLRVEAVTEGQSCDWEFQATYHDATGRYHEMTLRDGDSPFFAEAIPTEPAQLWIADPSRLYASPSYLVACHEEPGASICR